MKLSSKITGKISLLPLAMLILLSTSVQAGNERGGAIAVDVLFQSSFSKIKSYFLNLDHKQLRSNIVHSPWLQEASMRDKKYTNFQIIQSFLHKKIELKFLAFTYGACRYEEDGVLYKGSLCFDLSDSGQAKIEIARSELKHLVAKGVSDDYAREQSSILLLHELVHLSGVKDHQIANQIAIEIYRAILNIDLEREISNQFVILDNVKFYFSPKVVGSSNTNEYEVADFICQVFYKKQRAISFDLSKNTSASNVLYFENIKGVMRYKKAVIPENEVIFYNIHCLN